MNLKPNAKALVEASYSFQNHVTTTERPGLDQVSQPLVRTVMAAFNVSEEDAASVVGLAIARIKTMTGLKDEDFETPDGGGVLVGWIDGFLLGAWYAYEGSPTDG